VIWCLKFEIYPFGGLDRRGKIVSRQGEILAYWTIYEIKEVMRMGGSQIPILSGRGKTTPVLTPGHKLQDPEKFRWAVCGVA